MSEPSTKSTRGYAADWLENQRHPNGRPQDALTWDKIFQDEPLEGQHWEGAYGLPAGSTREGWETRNAYDSDSDLSDFSDFELRFETQKGRKRDNTSPEPPLGGSDTSIGEQDYPNEHSLNATIAVEDFQALQYWISSSIAPRINDRLLKFDLGDPSSLGTLIFYCLI